MIKLGKTGVTEDPFAEVSSPCPSACPTAPSCLVTPLPGIGERRVYRDVVQPFAAHSHDHYVIGLIQEGHRTLVCNERPFELAPGDLVIFNPGDVHACEQSDGGVFAYDSIAIDARLLDGAALTGPRVRNVEATRAFRETTAAIEALAEARTAEASNGAHAAKTLANPEATGKAPATAFADKARATEIPNGTPANLHPADPSPRPPAATAIVGESVLHLCELLLADDREATPPHLHDEAARHVMAHFCGHLSKPGTLEELAAREGLSPYALIRAYRSRFSITPMKHLASLRVECARRLLAEGVEPAIAAAEVGFADQPHLTRAFKQRLGITPAAYQKMTKGR